jgi:hypothetical protein
MEAVICVHRPFLNRNHWKGMKGVRRCRRFSTPNLLRSVGTRPTNAMLSHSDLVNQILITTSHHACPSKRQSGLPRSVATGLAC